MRKLLNACEFIRKRGLIGFAKESYYRMSDEYFEKHFNVSTAGEISREGLGISFRESVEYGTIPYKHILGILGGLPMDTASAVLLDYGCGKGRVVVCAAAQGYRKVIGVELSGLSETARGNLEAMRNRKTEDVEILQCDAREFRVPPDVNVIYFFNPFTGSILDKVIGNIRSSFEENRRKLRIIFFNNDHFEKAIRGQEWLVKTSQSVYYPSFTCGIYESRP